MLAAHLDLDSDVASRNISTIKKTVEWISSVSKENAKILDVSVNFSGVVRRKNIIYWIML
jgi:lysozyme family protein